MGPDGERDKSFVRAPPPLHLAIHLLLLLRSSWHQTEQREGGQVVLLRDSVGGAAGGHRFGPWPKQLLIWRAVLGDCQGEVAVSA